MDELLWDPEGGGYFNNRSGDASILLRMKAGGPPCGAGCGGSPAGWVLLLLLLAPVATPCIRCRRRLPLPCARQEDYDGAEPAASSIALANLWRLASLSGAEASAVGASVIWGGRVWAAGLVVCC